ncbi:hypothetical protein QEN19_003776 [Hanseniaspora menglaensis]
MSITSLEINGLILQYLEENNLLLSHKAIQHELSEKYETKEISTVLNSKQVPFGMLVNLIQKGILYSQLETISSNTNSTTRHISINDNIYSLQQLFEDNQDKLLYASNEPEVSTKGVKKRKNSGKNNGSSFTSESNNKKPTDTYEQIETEFKTRFTDLFNNFEKKQKAIELNKIEPKIDSAMETLSEPEIYKKWLSLEPLINYRASSFATIKGSSLLTAAKQPSRDTGYLSFINIKHLKSFNADEDINNIKMCKTIKKKTATTVPSTDTIAGINTSLEGVAETGEISLNPLGNKDLLLFHLQNSSTDNTAKDEIIMKEEEIVLFNQPTSTFIQINDSKTLFVSCLEEGEILLYSLPENKLLSKLSMHKSSIISCKFNESSENLISLDTSGNMILWDLTNYTVLKIFENSKQQTGGSLAGIDFLFIDNNKFMIPIKEEEKMNCVGVFEISAPNPAEKKIVKFLGKLKSSASLILSMSIFTKLKLLITASDDNKIRVYKGKNLALPTFSLDFNNEDDSILDVYTNEIEEDFFLISAVSIKGCISNWVLNLKSESEDGNFSVYTCNLNSELLLGNADVPVIFSAMHSKKYVVLGQIDGKVHVFDISCLFKKEAKENYANAVINENEEVLKKQKIAIQSENEIKLLRSFDNSKFENINNSHITSLETFSDDIGDVYLNVGYDCSSSKIFKL